MIAFNKYYNHFNFLSSALIIISLLLLIFKGLNFGIDFKGGTLIELRSNNTEASTIRSLLNNMNLGDINVKKFGQEGDYLIKVEQKINESNINAIEKEKVKLKSKIPIVVKISPDI